MKRRLLHTILLAAALSSAPATAFADTPVKAYKSSAYTSSLLGNTHARLRR